MRTKWYGVIKEGEERVKEHTSSYTIYWPIVLKLWPLFDVLARPLVDLNTNLQLLKIEPGLSHLQRIRESKASGETFVVGDSQDSFELIVGKVLHQIEVYRQGIISLNEITTDHLIIRCTTLRNDLKDFLKCFQVREEGFGAVVSLWERQPGADLNLMLGNNGDEEGELFSEQCQRVIDILSQWIEELQNLTSQT